MPYRYAISDKGVQALEEAAGEVYRRSYGTPLGDHLLVLNVLDSEFTYTGPEGKTVAGLKRELFDGPGVSERQLEQRLDALYGEGFVTRSWTRSSKDPAIKHQRYPYPYREKK